MGNRVGPKTDKRNRKTTFTEQKSALKTLLGAERKKGGGREEVETWSKSGRGEDIESMLSLPIHAVPSPSSLQNTIVRNRVLALPKLRLPLNSDTVDSLGEVEEGTSKKIQKYQQMFRFNLELPPDQDLKSFCKRLKSQTL